MKAYFCPKCGGNVILKSGQEVIPYKYNEAIYEDSRDVIPDHYEERLGVTINNWVQPVCSKCGDASKASKYSDDAIEGWNFSRRMRSIREEDRVKLYTWSQIDKMYGDYIIKAARRANWRKSTPDMRQYEMEHYPDSERFHRILSKKDKSNEALWLVTEWNAESIMPNEFQEIEV